MIKSINVGYYYKNKLAFNGQIKHSSLIEHAGANKDSKELNVLKLINPKEVKCTPDDRILTRYEAENGITKAQVEITELNAIYELNMDNKIKNNPDDNIIISFEDRTHTITRGDLLKDYDEKEANELFDVAAEQLIEIVNVKQSAIKKRAEVRI